jgi:phage tail-like protein
MSNPLLTGFYFSVSFSGQSSTNDAAFSEVTGLSKSLNVEEVVSGGENRFKYRLPTQVSFENLTLKRGIVLVNSPLINWCEETLDNGLAMAIKPRDVIVKLLNGDGEPCQTWTFVKAYPLKWSVSEFSSEKNALLIETIELAFQYFNLEKRA